MFELKNTGFGTNLILYCLSVVQCKPVVSVQHLPDQSQSRLLQIW